MIPIRALVLRLRAPRLHASRSHPQNLSFPRQHLQPCRPNTTSCSSASPFHPSEFEPGGTRLSRLRSPVFWRYVLSEYRTAIKWAIYINIGLGSVQLSIHLALLRVTETHAPTPSDWQLLTRYYLLRANTPTAWNPWGPSQSDKERLEWIEGCIKELEREIDIGGALLGGTNDAASERFHQSLKQKSQSWREGYMRARKQYGALLENARRYTEAEAEYRAALAIPIDHVDSDTTGVGVALDRIRTAARLAAILEWRGAVSESQSVLSDAVTAAPAGSAAQLDAQAELGAFLARHGELVPALEMLTRVLVARRTAEKVADAKKYTDEAGDPCKEAAAMASVGEICFALGKRVEGVRWSEKSWDVAVRLMEYRQACKDCCSVVAENLRDMGEIMVRDAEKMEEKRGWFGGGGGSKERTEMLEEGKRLKEYYGGAMEFVESIRAVRDSTVDKTTQ